MSLIEEPPDTRVSVRALVKRCLATGDLKLRANEAPVGAAADVRSYERPGYRGSADKTISQAVFEVPVEQLANGRNDFVFRNSLSDSLTIYGVELHVGRTD